MNIGGLQKFSLIDYPGKICAIIFTQGCNFRCGYCHNPELVDPEQFTPALDERKIIDFLKERQGKLDAVSITGGEPLLQKGLPKFISELKNLGFLVKLDTNGTKPDILKKLINQQSLDYVAMDIKASLERYEEVVNRKVNLKDIEESIKLIMDSGLEYEFRTTIVKSQLSFSEIKKMAQLISGAELYILQKFVATKANDPKFLKAETYTDAEFEELKKDVLKYVKNCEVR